MAVTKGTKGFAYIHTPTRIVYKGWDFKPVIIPGKKIFLIGNRDEFQKTHGKDGKDA